MSVGAGTVEVSVVAAEVWALAVEAVGQTARAIIDFVFDAERYYGYTDIASAVVVRRAKGHPVLIRLMSLSVLPLIVGGVGAAAIGQGPDFGWLTPLGFTIWWFWYRADKRANRPPVYLPR